MGENKNVELSLKGRNLIKQSDSEVKIENSPSKLGNASVSEDQPQQSSCEKRNAETGGGDAVKEIVTPDKTENVEGSKKPPESKEPLDPNFDKTNQDDANRKRRSNESQEIKNLQQVASESEVEADTEKSGTEEAIDQPRKKKRKMLRKKKRPNKCLSGKPHRP